MVNFELKNIRMSLEKLESTQMSNENFLNIEANEKN